MNVMNVAKSFAREYISGHIRELTQVRKHRMERMEASFVASHTSAGNVLTEDVVGIS